MTGHALLFSLSRRFWLIYSLFWLPYAAIYVFVFMAADDFPFLVSLAISLANVLPNALLGVGVVLLSRRLPWPPTRRMTFGVVLSVAAVLYAVGSSVLSNICLWGLSQTAFYDATEMMIFHPGMMLWQTFMGFVIYFAMISVLLMLKLKDRLRAEEARTATAELLRAQAELKALRAQLNPHFLFNTLHSLLALVRHEPGTAEEALEQFGDLLHYTLRVQRESVEEGPLGEEWNFVLNYVHLEKLRLGDRLRTDFRVSEESLGYLFPVFGLQPLVENAIRHGISPRASGGLLTIETTLVDDRLVLRVADDGPGALAKSPSSEGGLGLRLVRERLRALYNDTAQMEIETQPGKGFEVQIRVPARRSDYLAEERRARWLSAR